MFPEFCVSSKLKLPASLLYNNTYKKKGPFGCLWKVSGFVLVGLGEVYCATAYYGPNRISFAQMALKI